MGPDGGWLLGAGRPAPGPAPSWAVVPGPGAPQAAPQRARAPLPGLTHPRGHFFLHSRVASVPGGEAAVHLEGPRPRGRAGWWREGRPPASPPVCRGCCLPSKCAAWTLWLGVWGPPAPRLHSRGGGRRRVGPYGLHRQVSRRLSPPTQHPDLCVNLPRGCGADLALGPAESSGHRAHCLCSGGSLRLRDHRQLLGATLAGEKGLKPRPRGEDRA